MYSKIKNKKSSIIFLLIAFLFVFNINFITPNHAKAVPVEDVLGAPLAITKIVWDKIQAAFNWTYKNIVATAFKKGLQTYMNTLAQQAAKDIVAGGAGQKALWTTDGWKDFNKKAMDSAGASFIDGISKGIASSTGVYIDVCEPPGGIDLKLKLQLKYSKLSSATLATPRCSLSSMKEKWGNLADTLRNNPSALVKLNGKSLAQITGDDSDYAAFNFVKEMIKVKESDVQYINITELSLAEFKDEAKKIAELSRVSPDSALPKTGVIDAGIKVPGQVSKENLTAIRAETKKVAEISTGSMVADSASIFLNTLMSEGLNKLVQNLLKSLNPQAEYTTTKNGTTGGSGGKGGGGLSPADNIDRIFATIGEIRSNITEKDIDVITELETGLPDDIIGNLNNGSIDSEFAQLLRKGQSGDPLSLQEAIKQNYLKDGKIFGYTDINSSNSVGEPSLNDGYSYTSMQKLRKARIIPVGWELAAKYIYEIGQTGNIPTGCTSNGCTLGNVVWQFDQKGNYYAFNQDLGIIDENKKIPNKYCGWRPLASDPYFIDITDKTLCEAYGESNNKFSNIETKWDGNGESMGYCYEYSFDSNGVLTGIPLANMSELYCVNTLVPNPTTEKYYEWKVGGCMVKEKDEADLCGLVDPNWIIKAPVQQCRLEGFYSALEMTESSNRYTDCADTAHCLKEDDFGNCIGGYDYCLKEKNIWRFKGNQCNSEFNTCTTLVDDKGESKSYLTNTLKDCPQEEVGCREYIKTKSCEESGNCSWNKTAGSIYFNSNIETCDASNASCNKLIEVKQGVNLIPNGSFEIDEDAEGFYGYQKPDGWIIGPNITVQDDGNASVGSKYIKHSGSSQDNLSINILTPDKGLYTFSYYVRGTDNSSVSPVIGVYYGEGTPPVTIPSQDVSVVLENNTDWIRKSGYFVISNPDNNTISKLQLNLMINGEVYLDAIQLELNNIQATEIPTGEAVPSSYKEYGDSGAKYIKTAPSYYSCDSANPRSECLNFAKQCSSQDVGCSAYYPTINNGVSMIPAIISDSDKCPSVCNGFDTFSQFPNYFDSLEASKNLNPSSLVAINRNFIPSSATDCPRAEESCELFTNLEKLSNGGESKEYYNKIRQCVKPEEVETILYYTWEGSDTAAYQLKTWKVLKSNIEDPYSTSGYAPCTSLGIGYGGDESQTGIDMNGNAIVPISGTECNDEVGNVSECDPNSDLDCRAFYDENAVVHYRLLSKTIPITEECIALRREAGEGDTKKVYKIVPSLSRTCSPNNVGCTRYEGNTAANVRNLLVENFESGTTNGWDVRNGNNAIASKSPSSESVSYNGQSMKVAIAGTTVGTNSSINLMYTGDNITITPGKKYILSFWAKAFSSTDYLEATDDEGDTSVYNIFNKVIAASNNQVLNFNESKLVANTDWALYDMSIISPEDISIGSTGLTLKFNIGIISRNNSDGIYIDNIVLKEVQSSFYKIKDSWNTPRVCFGDASSNNVEYLGCQKYNDKNNIPVYLYNFSNLCKEENVGCKAMIDTHNSDMPFQQTFNAYCENENTGIGKECSTGKYYYKNSYDILGSNVASSTVIVPKDNMIYIVDNDKFSCTASNKGCSALGTTDDSSIYYDTYLINNPDNYIPNDRYGNSDKQTLCLSDYMNCVAFTKPDNSRIYKIHPRGLECEYKEADQVHNIKAGFYTKTGESCSNLLYNENYDNLSYDLANSWKPFGEYNYSNKYAATCDSESSGCSQFIDPQDNKNMRDYAETNLGDNLNFSDPAGWTKAFWNRDSGSMQLSGAITSTSTNRGNVLDYQISQSGSNKLNMLAYKFSETTNLYNFFTNSGDIYRLGAWVKFDGNVTNGNESVITFLNCRPFEEDLLSFYDISKNPNAFPYLSSKSYVRESGSEDGWRYIYGLYKVMPGANYCSVAFYTDGSLGSHVLFDDISLEKVEGNYYYINNDSIDDSSCKYPSLKEGCVLFDNTADSNLYWNANNSYSKSVSSPGDDNNPSDTNVLLKVTRDRQCGEWATCGSKIKSFDARSGQEKSSCVSLIACDEISDVGNFCSHPFNRSTDVKPLTLDSYRQDRGTYSWSDLDLSGYSIPGLYPIDSLSSIKTSATSGYTLGHIVVKNTGNNNFVYRMGIGITNPLSSPYNNNVNLPLQNINKSCRLYPEADSPFPWTESNGMVTEVSMQGLGYVIPKTKSDKFKNANICQPNYPFSISDTEENQVIADGADCDCSYTKAVYGSETLYYPYDEKNVVVGSIPSMINTPYEDNVPISSKTQHLGLKGYCLEYDKSYAINNTKGQDSQYRCLSWYPVETLSGEIDSYSMASGANINQFVPVDSKLCAIASDWTTPEDRVYCGYFGLAGNCNVLVKVPQGSKINMQYYKDHLDTASKILNGNGYSGNTWLDNNNLYVFEETPSDIGKSIIRRQSPVEMTVPDDNNEQQSPEDNKFSRAENFGNIGGDTPGAEIYDFLSDTGFSLNKLFAPTTAGAGLIRFFYDEDVNTSNGVDNTNSYFDLQRSVFSKGSHCGGCNWADTDACIGINVNGQTNILHEVKSECKKGDHGGSSCIYRNMKRWCAPRNYNYYVSSDLPASSYTFTMGNCGPNCIFSDSSVETLNNGIGCFRSGVDGYNHYENLLNTYKIGSVFNLNLCIASTTPISNSTQATADCSYVNCMENSGINQGSNHLCSDYKNTSGTQCNSFLYTAGTDNFIGSASMKSAYNKCILGGMIDGINYEDGPESTMSDPTDDCCNYYNEDGTSCLIYNCMLGDNSCCDGTCRTDILPVYGNLPPSVCTSGSSCVQSCLSTFSLNDVIFNANNFYLSMVNIIDGSKQEDCNVGGIWVCPEIRTSNPSEYAIEKNISYNRIWQGASFVDIQSRAPFSALFNNDEASGFALNVVDAPSSSYGFYSNSQDSDKNNFVAAKNRLDDVVIFVPNSNFQYKQFDNTWLQVENISGTMPTILNNLPSDYWKLTNNTNPPIVKSVQFDSTNNTLSEGASGISVNNTTGANIKNSEGSLYANLSFYAYTSSGREPIKSIKIHWGNDAEITLEGPFKNRKSNCDRRCGSNYKNAFLNDVLGSECYDDSTCAPGACYGYSWGDTQDACQEDNKDKNETGYFSYTYIYSCEPGNNSWVPNCSQYDLPGGCCVFTPTVTVTDNWGTPTDANLGTCNGEACSIIISPR